ncbi:ferric iron uptake transcriptional regulator [Psychrosphaera aestuarii]|uniref:ferric iron uptake transcriptional regulator n=1 Tax=Psychrosphaera aestuarii TaxID=1266052 RepID=UPI001B32157A|nr:ferric iron uptake transcriptional regulator [Psychrosphaera aestuarii]
MSENDLQLKNAGLKVTSPRLKVLELLKSLKDEHISAEDLYKLMLEHEEEIGLATIYRVLNQFDDAGIVTRHHFEGGKSVFELANKKHHDHLVCLDCGKVLEFTDDVIEKRQDDVAKRNGIELTNHSLYLYGNCVKKDCENRD